MNKKIFLSLIWVSLLSCNTSESDFPRENELLNFLNENGIISQGTDLITVIVYRSDCKTCMESVSNVLENLIGIKKVSIIYENQDVYEQYTSLDRLKFIEIISDSATLASRGLYFPNNTIFFIKNSSKIKDWNEIGYDTMDKIIKKIRRFSS